MVGHVQGLTDQDVNLVNVRKTAGTITRDNVINVILKNTSSRYLLTHLST